MKSRRFAPVLLLMWLGVLAVLLASLCLGRYPVGPQTVVRVLISRFVPIARTWDPTVETVIWQVRLPRALAAALVGAALASGGAVFQGLFHNPLVSPYVLGVSSGAGFGAAVAILLGAGAAATQASAFATGALAVSLTWMVARSGRDGSHVTLVLAGLCHRQPVLLAGGWRTICGRSIDQAAADCLLADGFACVGAVGRPPQGDDRDPALSDCCHSASLEVEHPLHG